MDGIEESQQMKYKKRQLQGNKFRFKNTGREKKEEEHQKQAKQGYGGIFERFLDVINRYRKGGKTMEVLFLFG